MKKPARFIMLVLYTGFSFTWVYTPGIIFEKEFDVIDSKDEPRILTVFREAGGMSFPCGLKEEASAFAPAIKVPALLKANLPPPNLELKLNGERHYINTRQRTVPVAWNPTIPIALRKLTI